MKETPRSPPSSPSIPTVWSIHRCPGLRTNLHACLIKRIIVLAYLLM